MTPRAVLSESAILGVFFLGLFLSRWLGGRRHPSELVLLFAVGLLFEILTAHLWTYHHVFLVLPTPIDSDISVMLPLGWTGLVLFSTAAAERVWARWGLSRWWAKHGVLAGIWLLCGAVGETFFYNIGVIEYIDIPARVFILGQLKPLPPTNYLVGYALVPPLFSQFLLWLERGLRERPDRE